MNQKVQAVLDRYPDSFVAKGKGLYLKQKPNLPIMWDDGNVNPYTVANLAHALNGYSALMVMAKALLNDVQGKRKLTSAQIEAAQRVIEKADQLPYPEFE